MVFIESQAFTRRLHQLAGVSADEVLHQIQEDLLRNPEKGDVAGRNTQGSHLEPDSRKGQARRLSVYASVSKHRDHLHLLFLLDKDEQEDLTTEQRRNLRLMAAELKSL